VEEQELDKVIVVEQLPKITQQLQLISDEVDKEIEYALSLEVNDDTIKEVKNVRAKLNKINTTLEEKRKTIKNAILSPYEQFLEIYDKLVRNKLNEADNTLKMQINTIEEKQKKEKQEELELFAKEYFKSSCIDDIVNFDDIHLNITLSASMKNLKEQIVVFCNNIRKDLDLIELENDDIKNEILFEYKKCLDYGKSKLIVLERKKELEKIEKQQEKQNEIKQQEQEVIEKVEEIVAPKEIIEDEDILTVTFTITDTKENIIKVRDFMKENMIKYE